VESVGNPVGCTYTIKISATKQRCILVDDLFKKQRMVDAV